MIFLTCAQFVIHRNVGLFSAGLQGWILPSCKNIVDCSHIYSLLFRETCRVSFSSRRDSLKIKLNPIFQHGWSLSTLLLPATFISLCPILSCSSLMHIGSGPNIQTKHHCTILDLLGVWELLYTSSLVIVWEGLVICKNELLIHTVPQSMPCFSSLFTRTSSTKTSKTLPTSSSFTVPPHPQTHLPHHWSKLDDLTGLIFDKALLSLRESHSLVPETRGKLLCSVVPGFFPPTTLFKAKY